MPRVPLYDALQVTPNTLPNARVTAPDMPDVEGTQTQQLSKGIMGVGGVVARIGADIESEANQVRLTDAMNKVAQARLTLTYDPKEGFVHLRGDNALTRPDGKSLDDEYVERFNKQLDAIEQTLGNQAQRIAFRQNASKLTEQFRGSLTQHVAKEYGDYRVGVQDGVIRTATQEMTLAWGNAEAVAKARMEIIAAVAEKGRIAGASPKQIEAATVDALSPGHAAVIASAIDEGKLNYAREYMKQVSAELTPTARLQLVKTLDEGQREERGQGNAEKYLKEAGGDTATALRLIRQNLSGRDEDAAAAYVKTWDAERVALRERGQKDAADQAWQMVAAGRRPPPSLLTAMDGRDAAAITRHLAEGPPQKTDVKKWLEFTNKTPDELAGMDPTTLMRDYRGSFSDHDLRNANEIILAAKGLRGKGKPNQEGMQLMTTADLLKRSAREMGILPKSGQSLTGEHEAAFLNFQDAMQTKINVWESTNGKKATPEVLATMLQEEKVNKVRLDVIGFDPERTVISLKPEELSKAYVKIGSGREIKLNSIPDNYRADAMRRIRARGVAPTEQLIAEMWAADNPEK